MLTANDTRSNRFVSFGRRTIVVKSHTDAETGDVFVWTRDGAPLGKLWSLLSGNFRARAHTPEGYEVEVFEGEFKPALSALVKATLGAV